MHVLIAQWSTVQVFYMCLFSCYSVNMHELSWWNLQPTHIHTPLKPLTISFIVIIIIIIIIQKLALNRISHHVVCIWNDNLFVDDYRRLVEG